jgi:glutathione S-transferase
MPAPLRLHFAPDNASLCVRLALETLSLDFDVVLVDRAVGGQKSPAFLALNPNGLIPVLETLDGPIYETAAILLWLADKAGALMPAPEAPARGAALTWLFWLSNTLHVAERLLFYPEQYIAAGQAETLRAATRQRIAAHLDLLDATNPVWLQAPSIHACYLAPLLRWPALYGGDTAWYDLSHWPRLHAFARTYETTGSARKAAEAEGLGTTPFSAPSLPNPPEGSAT